MFPAKGKVPAAFTGDQEILSGHEVMHFIPQPAERFDKALTVVRQHRQAVAVDAAYWQFEEGDQPWPLRRSLEKVRLSEDG